MRLSTILLIALISVSGCKVENRVTSSKTHLSVENKQNILFLNFKIEQDSLENIQIDLIKHYWITGSFKENKHNLVVRGDVLKFRLLGKNEQLLKEVMIENPLKSSQEVFSPEGTIERKNNSIDQAEFTVRVNVSNDVTFVSVNDGTDMLSLIELK